MKESNKIEHDLAVEVKDKNGRIKDVRYVHFKNDISSEFVPNRLYLYLLNKGFIKGNSYKIPFLLGKRIIYGNHQRF